MVPLFLAKITLTSARYPWDKHGETQGVVRVDCSASRLRSRSTSERTGNARARNKSRLKN